MKTTYFNKEYDYNLEINYRELLSNGWYNRLHSFIHGYKMPVIMYSMFELYKEKIVYPSLKKDLFSIFNKLDLQEINVCIIDCNPTITHRSNGVAFANKISYNNDYDEHLVNLLNKINNYNQETEHTIDYTLDDWVSQGVFLYNTTLSQIKDSTRAQKTKWFEFSKEVLKVINNSTTGMIFLFIGSQENKEQFITLIDPKKHIVLENHVLDYDSLNAINLEIDGINGKNYRIKW